MWRDFASVTRLAITTLLVFVAPPSARAQSTQDAERARTDSAITESLQSLETTQAHSATTHESPRRVEPLSFIPHSSERCASFVLLEAGVAFGGNGEESDHWLISDGLGLMVNAGPWSAGGAGEVHLVGGNLYAAPSFRLRRWFGGEQNIELAVSFIHRREDRPGTTLTSPIATIRYGPVPELSLKAGMTRFRELRVVRYDWQTGRQWLDSRDLYSGFAGIDVTGRPGAALWGVQLAMGMLGLLLLAAMAGMYESY